MDNSQVEIKDRLKRLDIVLRKIKKDYNLKTNEAIAQKLNYKRSGTLSDYKNPNEYSEKKFLDFVNKLKNSFNVNPDYIINGKGEIYLESMGGSDKAVVEKLQNIKSAIVSLNKLVNDLEYLLEK